ncbi:hypothetical protein [Pleionea sediminis]|uniref:hypothetical protein n=1 Tax=Pleionea sediminis TaxID=2569479 RepID=UPI0011864E5B|nr:hypothetical protein [Pleionea sediminis]
MIVKKILRYVIGKFFELAILSLILFYIGYVVEPSEYSRILPFLLVISTTTIIYSGIGSSFIKDVKINEVSSYDIYLKRYFSQTLIIGICLALCFLIFNDKSALSLLICGVLFFNAFRSFGQSYYRSLLEEVSLIKFNCAYPVVTLMVFVILMHLDADIIDSYMIAVFFGLLSSAAYIVFFMVRKFAAQHLTMLYLPRLKTWLVPLQHLVINGAIFIFLFVDKFIVNKTMPEGFIGQYQLYDNFSNLFYMGVSSCLYLLSPYLLSRYSSPDGFDKGGKFQLYYLLIIFILSTLYIAVSSWVIHAFFSSYADYIEFFYLQITLKGCALTIFLPSIFYMYLNKEKNFSMLLYSFMLSGAVLICLFGFLREFDFQIVLLTIVLTIASFSVFTNTRVFIWNKTSNNG